MKQTLKIKKTDICFFLLFLENYFFFSSNAAINLLPPYLEKLGASHAFTGFFMNINSLTLVVAVVLFSHFIPRLDRKRTLNTVFFISMAANLLMFMFHSNFHVLAMLRFAASFAYLFGFTMHANMAFELIPRNRRAGGMALFGLSGVFSNPTGAVLGEVIINNYSYHGLFVLAFCFSTGAFFMSMFLKDGVSSATERSSRNFFSVLMRKGSRSLYLYGFLLGGAFSTFATFLPGHSKTSLGFANLSYFFVSHGVVSIVMRIFFNKWMDRLRPSLLVSAGLLSASIAMFVSLNLVTCKQLIFSGLLYGLGHSILYPLLGTLIIHTGSDGLKDTLNNAYIASYTLGCVGITTLLGLLADLSDLKYVFLAKGIVLFVNSLTALWFLRKIHQQRFGVCPAVAEEE
ncbi:MAG: MFS transporter [Spirochaetes bacterium]|nr:MFS transporter [Spirochaetota bacterium]